MWSVEDFFSILPTGYLSTLFTSNISDEWKSRRFVVCVALEAIMKYQFEQLNKISVAATAVRIDKEVMQNWKVQDCVYIQFVTSKHLPFFFGILTFRFVEFDITVICRAVFIFV